MKTNYANTSMLDMVFEQRNKAYGAYVLRQSYNHSLKQAMALTLTSVFILCFANAMREHFKNKSNGKQPEIIANLATLPAIPQKKDIKPVEPPKQQQAKAKATIENPEKKVVNETQAHADTIATKDDLEKFDSGIKTNTTAATDGAGVTDGTGKENTFEVAKSISAGPPPVVDYADVMPQFPGGENALRAFLSKNTSYPDYEKEAGIQGKAYVRFVVNEDGSISNAEILRSESKGFSREALHVVSVMPHFIPGSQRGKTVKVHYVLPFHFKLND
jgi:protein TonB